ncbi:hypothetical protein JOF29_002408 [Kribbella aluminosa]|uniref:Uncharacterized protein n=1 Tax=Kribbella aluminosa TaxID=416017 RepID=A0ABS4UI77_9ACTN|nr:hypothetical protein [Kribbella aluminosa]MBP2351325.1 hypothetical protein [Kribbella aluminosa]
MPQGEGFAEQGGGGAGGDAEDCAELDRGELGDAGAAFAAVDAQSFVAGERVAAGPFDDGIAVGEDEGGAEDADGGLFLIVGVLGGRGEQVRGREMLCLRT